ncbi:hypothetical protein AA103196_2970 [Ameyamaea chiangmaiensis NBRC 103196]|uniref:Zinc-ribbon domain-containing protein n=1 Tax=Ameyamaea chiangmaiensis TaxID=442969 RepID=A0A850PDE7_9PROT|nr:zinc-ribbon domain-containing protein [Ameyamaea chiangmaiensis]MBS4074459.1 zinc-ribbon domain-containing protein [Ameyamaea chiangmaiensis]NVN42028.1 zinc-ribbon domain-containing protein [Ameyamaea chiangmaiensis]GBQ72112.1 hypothetical protein AA103196_2970 [Ameyamaea chiangmaiensis NBRC 103196]
MLITCPSCHATYDVPVALLKAGRTVQCADCGASWEVAPEAGTSGADAASGDGGQDVVPRQAHSRLTPDGSAVALSGAVAAEGLESTVASASRIRTAVASSSPAVSGTWLQDRRVWSAGWVLTVAGLGATAATLWVCHAGVDALWLRYVGTLRGLVMR